MAGSNDSRKAIEAAVKSFERPCMLSELQDKLGKQIGKAAVAKSVAELVAEGVLVEKVIGKQKMYGLVFQNKNIPKVKVDVKCIKAEISKLEAEIKGQLKIQSVLEKKTLKFTQTPEDLQNENDELKKRIKEKEKEIQKLTSEPKKQNTALDPKKKAEILKKFDGYVVAYKKRKALCRDMIDSIMENYPGSRKKLLEEIGVETDEEVGFELKPN